MSATIVLAVIGAFNVFATTQQRLINQGFNPYFYVTRQVTFLIIAAVVLTLVMAVGHDWLRSKSVILYVAVVMSLALLFIAGQVTGGARLSFDLGIIAVQPAEIAKSVLVIFLASYLADAAAKKIEWEEFVIVLMLAGLPMVLVLAQPDLGSASVLAAGTAGILLAAGVKRRHVIAIAAMSLAFSGASGRLAASAADSTRFSSSIAVASPASESRATAAPSARWRRTFAVTLPREIRA